MTDLEVVLIHQIRLGSLKSYQDFFSKVSVSFRLLVIVYRLPFDSICDVEYKLALLSVLHVLHCLCTLGYRDRFSRSLVNSKRQGKNVERVILATTKTHLKKVAEPLPKTGQA